MPTPARRVAAFGATIFTEMTQLAQQHQALNLGQGKPDFDPPASIVAHLVAAAEAGTYHQYPPGAGTLHLRQAVAAHALRFYDLVLDADAGVLITVGATEGIFAAIMGLVDPGDEVILIEPYFDSYLPNVLMAGATPVFVPLHGPDWTFDPAELRAAFTPRTRAIILNTPHNPTGRVFTLAELTLIAEHCQAHDVTVIADEVYEHMVFAPAQHIPIATLPGMFARTVTVSSAGKLFSITGWKVGWVAGPPNLIVGVGQAHQFITFSVNHPAQAAVAATLSLPASYYTDFQAMYTHKRDLMLTALERGGFRVCAPEGTYFVLADFSALSDRTPVAFARYLTSEIGVACIPPETFYCPAHVHFGSAYVRFAFCKHDDVLLAAGERLARLRMK